MYAVVKTTTSLGTWSKERVRGDRCWRCPPVVRHVRHLVAPWW
jgi:hypothetical protein